MLNEQYFYILPEVWFIMLLQCISVIWEFDLELFDHRVDVGPI